MRREIKFRAWDVRHNKMFEVESVHQDQVDYIVRSDTDYDRWKPTYGYLSRDELSLMQYTGIDDNTSKEVEIYEGYILYDKD